MNWPVILKTQGFLLVILALVMLTPIACSLIYGGTDLMPLLWGLMITLSSGIFLILVFSRNRSVMRAREGFVSVTLGWIFAAIFSAIPFYLHGSFGTIIDCVFETMSGFTTTGATILTEIESLPRGLLFWRSMTHWLGGMGIILLTIAILPLLGFSGAQLFKAEVPGPVKDRFSPRIKDTAKILWLIYGGLTAIETILLMLGGMDLFDALCHSFGTMATGGFSTRNASIASFNSIYIEVVITIFMYLAGINFSLFFFLFKGKPGGFFKNREWRFYTIVLIAAILLVSLVLAFNGDGNGIEKGHFGNALRHTAFQVVSITTTTGYITYNYDFWPYLCQLLLIGLMFLGGSGGSTGGGIKQIRVMILLKSSLNEIRKLSQPRAVFATKIGHELISKDVVRTVYAFFFIYILVFGTVTILLAALGHDIVTSFSAAVATLSNIGPGLARVGAVENYAFFDPASKVILTLSMLMGRLELMSVLIFFYALFSRRSN
jgi:trk system potassium uptake protein TrkH